MAITKQSKRLKVKKRIRKTINGSAERPRMSVYRSNKDMYVQLINDDTATTLVSASTRDKDFKEKGTKTELAQKLGKVIAEKAKANGVDKVVFDRNGFVYHGRIKAVAEGAREGGLNF